MIDGSDIRKITRAVTKKWTAQIKAEERGRRSRGSRQYVYSDRIAFSEVMNSIIPKAYAHASGDGRYTVSARQLYYAAREDFKKQTGREGITQEYFCHTLMRQYMNRHPETERWKITKDARGTLTIPNAAEVIEIPCGTLQMEAHLKDAARSIDPLEVAAGLDIQWPSVAGDVRYQAVLYIEKEGFGPLLREAQIAERFDIAVLSCKGQSVGAGRQYVDSVCYFGSGVPLLVVHDLDKSGFEISQRLTQISDYAEERDTVLYRFQNDIDVTDLGLRLTDVEKYGLASESCRFNGHFASDSLCTEAEKAFLRSHRRVELNSFTAPQFIEWIEGKLTEQGLGTRLVPDADVLEDAYRRAVIIARLNAAIADTTKAATAEAKALKVPKTLRRQLQTALKITPEPWDQALARMIQSKLYPDADD